MKTRKKLDYFSYFDFLFYLYLKSIKQLKAQGKELIFISRILRDGTGVEMIESQDEVEHLRETSFDLMCLSLSHSTYLASSFNSYIVKLLK